VHAGAAPNFGGRLQPYLLHLPRSPKRPGLTLALHGNTATYTQYVAVSPNYLEQIGDERNSVILMPLGRSTQGSGMAYDWFEAWADVARRFDIDSERVALSGYSAGGYHTFVLGAEFPDLFGGVFAIVGAARLLNGGAAGDSTNFIPMLGNVRWVPYVAWNQAVDELAPYVGIRATQQKFNELGLRSQVYTFFVGEHFFPGLLDQWTGAAEFLGESRVKRDPSRVDFGIAPVTWKTLSPDYGPDKRFPRGHLVADHAYWVSGLRTRATVRDDTGTVRGFISAVSRAFGEGDPSPERVMGAYSGPPQPATVDGTSWSAVPRTKVANALDVNLTNLRSATIWGRRARLTLAKPLTVTITSDGAAIVRLRLPNEEGTHGDHALVDREGVTFRVEAGTTRFVLEP
jgi:pimeloyl-ACP methyl ester carboxylesterase